ncbi:hypothetical protein GJ496_003722 [Pomphorhynchus laevis]|nr:hypothetical protein GJ496_003722 [Pomphorhynchus laevis]
MTVADRSNNIDLLKYRSNVLLHWNIGPFLILLISFLLSSLPLKNSNSARIAIIALCGFTVLLSIFICLACYWNARIRAVMQFSKVSSIEDACAVLILSGPYHEDVEIVWLIKDYQNSASRIWFKHQKEKYFYDFACLKFEKQKYPDCLPISKYISSNGLCSKDEILTLTENYGENTMEIEFPSFRDQLLDRVLAPMFIFQCFCIALMCLNEYWHYSLLIFCLLIIFEVILVVQQQRNLTKIKEMGNTSCILHAYRERRWVKLLSSQLLPGDICAVCRNDKEEVLPCDLVLLHGNCIVDESLLTGESIPVLKEPLSSCEELDVAFDKALHEKLHVLHSGTKIIQHTNLIKNSKWRIPQNGCLAYVLRTGFATNQGSLLKTMLLHVNKLARNDFESYLFIGFLMIFAVIAACYVWINGQNHKDQSQYKLFLSCIMIVTDVIPPELSMELSNAVNCSLLQLCKRGIFCTEPFRIPYAGKIDICCFDKTGTLTSDELIMEGVAYDINSITKPEEVSSDTMNVIAVCHSLIVVDGEIIGDPIEKAALFAINWTMNKNDSVLSKVKGRNAWHIDHRYHFASSLGRMAVIASTVTAENKRKVIFAVKGAPEYLQSMFINAPDDYMAISHNLAERGRRILALGYKDISNAPGTSKREELERELTFVGFLVIESPLKHDSKQILSELIASSHHIKMITGDSLLTACHVARQLNMFNSDKSMYTLDIEGVKAHWHQLINSQVQFPIEEYNNMTICLSGQAIEWLINHRPDLANKIILRTLIFARTKPNQKEFVLNSLRSSGYCTLMCGDGTNDVGALKNAHVGVALCSTDYKKQFDKNELVSPVQYKVDKNVQLSSARDKSYEKHNAHAKFNQMLNEADPPLMKLGDASIAAPFTSRSSSIDSVTYIIRQGRCTLVTTLQIFKILALNALILAYGRSVLYLQGVKYSDSQATIEGIFIALAFFAISRSQPIESLSKERPIPDIMNMYTLLTVLIQSSIHLLTLLSASKFASQLQAQRTDIQVNLEAPFSSSLLNSTIFALVIILQASNFAVNYKGHPYMKSLFEHKSLASTLIASTGFVIFLVSGCLPYLSNYFEIVIFPHKLLNRFMMCVLCDLIGSFLCDRLLYFLLSPLCSKLKQI